MANRLTKAEMKALLDAAGMTPEQAGLPADLRLLPMGNRRKGKSNVHARTAADADVAPRPPGAIICAGCVVGHAVPWRAPKTDRNGNVIPTPDHARYKAWRNTVSAFAKVEMGPLRPYGLPVDLEASFYLRPDGPRGDLCNLVKCFEDGLQGVVFVNDAQVHGHHTTIWLTEDEPERVEYVVTAR